MSDTPIVDKVLPAVLYDAREAGHPEKLFTEALLAECVVFGDDYANLLHIARRVERVLKVAEPCLLSFVEMFGPVEIPNTDGAKWLAHVRDALAQIEKEAK